jgi:cytoskeletal protein CcmA (bactofilin family)
MLQSPDKNSSNTQFSSNPNSFAPAKTTTVPTEQATIGRSLVIKGEISGAESLYVDGKIEGTINLAEHRVTVGRNGIIAANINAREVVIMGKVTGNIQCSDRLDIRSEGSVAGDVVTMRISVEDGAVLKGSVQVRSADGKHDKNHQSQQKPVTSITEQPKAAAATAGQA